MKRQIQSIKVLTAAALLSVGMSMSAFAAEGWAEENGGWAYYDAEGKRVANQLLELDGDYYYIGEDGLMVSSQWVSIVNENIDPEELLYDDEYWVNSPYEEEHQLDNYKEEPKRYWYYFQENGKAYKKSGSSSSATRTKEIDGKKYAFDDEGRMLYGWVADGERVTGEDAWRDGEYYFGDEDDGALKTGWQKIKILVDDEEEDELLADDGVWEEGIQDRWFYFSETGKKTKAKQNDDMKKLTLHGQKYGFDQYGRMISAWYADPTLITTEGYDRELDKEINKTQRQGGSDYSKEFMYFGSPESGARYMNGWFNARPSLYLMKEKHEEGSTYTYYADGNGNLCTSEIRTIGGEKYAFDSSGRLVRGLVCLTMEDETTSSKIQDVWYADKTDREFATVDEFNELVAYERYDTATATELLESYPNEFASGKKRFYYFYGRYSEMLTGPQMVNLGDETVEFEFADSGRLKGSGLFGKKNGKLYKAGMLIKPEEGQKYAIVKVEDKTQEIRNEVEHFQTLDKISVQQFISEVCNSGISDDKKDEIVWTVRYEPENVKYYLVSQSGHIVKSKSNARDDDGYQFRVKNNKIISVTAEQ